MIQLKKGHEDLIFNSEHAATLPRISRASRLIASNATTAPDSQGSFWRTTTQDSKRYDDVAALESACEINLQVWDTPGQEIYRSLVKLYYRNVQGVVLVVSLDDSAHGITNQLASLDFWLEEMSQVSTDQKFTCILIANKADTLLMNSERGGLFHEAVIK